MNPTPKFNQYPPRGGTPKFNQQPPRGGTPKFNQQPTRRTPKVNQQAPRRTPGTTLYDPSTLPPDPYPDWNPETEVGFRNHYAGDMVWPGESALVVSHIRGQQSAKPFRSRSHGSKEDNNRRLVHMFDEMSTLLWKIDRLQTALELRFWNSKGKDNKVLLFAITSELCAFHRKLTTTIHSVGDMSLMAEFHTVLIAARRKKFSLWNALCCDITATIKMLGEHVDVLGENFYALNADAQAYASRSKAR